MTTLSTRAMLVTLNIHQWTARKFDKQATREVEQHHLAKDAGRFNKILIDPTALRGINRWAAALRDKHYAMTLPWGDNGDRLLPAALYLDFQSEMQSLAASFDGAVRLFANDYQNHVSGARMRLGSLYDPKDYPPAADIPKRFRCELSFALVPDVQDFRVDIGDAAAEQIRADVSRSMAERQQAAMDDALLRAKEVITRVRDRVTAAKPVIHDSLTESVADLIRVLPAFNLSNDPRVNEVVDALNNMTVSAQGLRNSARSRDLVADAADDILQRMGWA